MITCKLELSGNSAPDSHRDSFLLIVLTKKTTNWCEFECEY
jgi:hypothetical protein